VRWKRSFYKMALTALKGKTLKRKKAPAARRKISGAKGAPLDDYKKCKNYFHFEVDNKEYVSIVKTYVKKFYDKTTAKHILKNKDYTMSKSHVAAFCHWTMNDKTAPEDSVQWMTGFFEGLAKRGETIVEEINAEEADVNKNVYVPSIQERIREASNNIIAAIEEQVDAYIEDPDNFKGFDAVKFFRSNKVNQAHSRHIRAFYEGPLAEYQHLQLPASEQHPDMREGYAHLDKRAVKRGVELFQGIISACDLITQESKATRKTRTPKPKSADKLVAKMKYCVSDAKYAVASINPADIIDATEVWVFNTKTRKIGKYVAEEHATLQVKGTTLQFFDEKQSVAKTLRKPEQQLPEFNKAGKVQLRKFLDNIKGVETKMNGRFNEQTVILKAIK
jgi:hypothetical protein